MEAGAAGFLVKDAPARSWRAAIRAVLAGERVIDPPWPRPRWPTGRSPLTAREPDVLRAARRRRDHRGRRGRLHLSEGTVRNYLSTAIQKTGARNRVEAVRVAEEKGWL